MLLVFIRHPCGLVWLKERYHEDMCFKEIRHCAQNVLIILGPMFNIIGVQNVLIILGLAFNIIGGIYVTM